MPDMNFLMQSPEVDIKLNQEAEPEAPLELPEIIPLIAVHELSLFPNIVLPMHLFNPGNQLLFSESLASHKQIGLVLIKGKRSAEQIKSLSHLHNTAMAALVLKMVRTENNGIRLLVQGLSRIRLLELVQTEPYLRARVSALENIGSDDLETQALMGSLKNSFAQMLELAPQIPKELAYLINGLNDAGALADLVASAINIRPLERQGILEELKVKDRLRQVNTLLHRELQVLELGNKIQTQVKEGLDKTQRDFYLRQQMKVIQNELGEGEGASQDVLQLRQKLEKKLLPATVRKEAEREMERLGQMHAASAEYQVVRDYLDWILALPWVEETQDKIDLKKARQILESRHYGLEKVKKRILEYLAVLKLNPELKGPILCLVGPPGVGKTSLGRSIAQALGRKFIRLSLGGVRDEAEIRGHRRTYVGAMPGRIIQSLRRVGSKNPVIILDEIDKLGDQYYAAPSSALLEVLDPEQNNNFSDHYLEMPFDLSRAIFVTTANMLDTIPPALRDRMEVLDIAGYTREEKMHIAKSHLIPRLRHAHGLTIRQCRISDKALRMVIDGYTREAGLRSLERQLGSLFRSAAQVVAEGSQSSMSITPDEVQEILGPEPFIPEAALRRAQPGVATGLAWTPVGGEILFIEATSMPGRGHLSLTGKLGDVMKESAQTALSYLRANAGRLGIEDNFFSSHDIHVHVPAGAIPKDGPSAGVTIFTALLSLMLNRAVKVDVAMTGEITLRGLVLPVGGIKEKVLAAQQAGIKTVLLPKRNQRDLAEVPPQIRRDLQIILVEQVEDLLSPALMPEEKTKTAFPARGKARPMKTKAGK